MTFGIGTPAESSTRATRELDGPFCYGTGKVEAMVKSPTGTGDELDLCYAYSDSASDLPMLEAVGHGGGQPRREPRTPRQAPWLADRDLQPSRPSRSCGARRLVGTIGIAGASFRRGHRGRRFAFRQTRPLQLSSTLTPTHRRPPVPGVVSDRRARCVYRSPHDRARLTL